MLKKPSPQQTAFEMVSLDGLVPKDHLLRKIDAVVDFPLSMSAFPGFTARTTGDRRSTSLMCQGASYRLPVRGALRTQQVREIEVNVAYRWFLGVKLTDPAFDASTLSQNRRRRFKSAGLSAVWDRLWAIFSFRAKKHFPLSVPLPMVKYPLIMEASLHPQELGCILQTASRLHGKFPR
jgi:transposase